MTGLSLRGLTVARARRLVVEDVSFTAPQGRVTALLGAKAAGKTTLLAAAAGLLPLLRGTVLLGGTDVTHQRRRGVAMLPPGTSLGLSSTVADALRQLAPRGGASLATDFLRALGLTDLASRRLSTLTHGEHHCALAAARLLPAGQALLVDEAGLGMERADQERLMAALRALAQEGRSVLIATRDEILAQAADQLVLLQGGRVLQAGTPASCYAEPRCAGAALLTGPANILQGAVRERRGGFYVWTAGGLRFLQAATPDTAPPPLGSQAHFCLRPERLTLLAADEQADNTLPGVLAAISSTGAALNLQVDTACGRLLVSVPSWPRPATTGGEVKIGWSSQAATVLDNAETK